MQVTWTAPPCGDSGRRPWNPRRGTRGRAGEPATGSSRLLAIMLPNLWCLDSCTAVIPRVPRSEDTLVPVPRAQGKEEGQTARARRWSRLCASRWRTGNKAVPFSVPPWVQCRAARGGLQGALAALAGPSVCSAGFRAGQCPRSRWQAHRLRDPPPETASPRFGEPRFPSGPSVSGSGVPGRSHALLLVPDLAGPPPRVTSAARCPACV